MSYQTVVTTRDSASDALVGTFTSLCLRKRNGLPHLSPESTPTKFLFQPVAPPSFDIGVGFSLVSAFRRYGSTLQRQITGRTPLLHKIVSFLEVGANSLREDSDGWGFYIFSHINRFHRSVTRKLTEKLREAYRPLMEDCCKAILTTLSLSSVAEPNSGTGTFLGFIRLLLERNLNADVDVRLLAFLSRLAEALHASPFCSYLSRNTHWYWYV
jgi:hypothetical protein